MLAIILAGFLFFPQKVDAQAFQKGLLQKHLSTFAQEKGFSQADVSDWDITHSHTTSHNGVSHVYIQQQYQGIPIYNAVANFALQDGKVVHMNQSFAKRLSQSVNTSQPGMNASQAIAEACQKLGLANPSNLEEMEYRKGGYIIFTDGGVSQAEIPVRLMYQPGPEGELFLSYDLAIMPNSGQDWWSVRIDANTGELRSKENWMQSCSFPDHPKGIHKHSHNHKHSHFSHVAARQANMMGGTYRVFPYFTESPNHGPRQLIVNPSDSLASPFGWHDTDGVAGAEFTITRGNNVWASEDRDADNQPGYSPDGGAGLVFDFPLNLSLQPDSSLDAAITNLFYKNNVIHDIFYYYGFTEAAGNFQANNYNRGGVDDDFVFADALDGGGLNNATFGTPPDGFNPRMTMFLWSPAGSVNVLTVNSPATVAGGYPGNVATFGPAIPAAGITADLVLATDGLGDPNDACDPLTNGPSLSGKIAVVRRGNCNFVDKVQAAQTAGALAVIIVNNVGGGSFSPGGNGPAITIPSVMISQADGNAIIAALNGGLTVNGTLNDAISPNIDGDYDNGIITHEYGHGISIRLTGGAATSNCLSNAEQMGEGWSDYFTLMLGLDTSFTDRGIGTFAIGQGITGGGIRPARYSRDLSINPFTYAATNQTGSISQPHGIGFVWCTMLWDMTLDLIDTYGYDSDIYSGSGGNNIALQLVVDGLKLQSCNPGFVDGRDAILLADRLNNGGANQCLIWEAFARRGLGVGASQGSSGSRTDQVEAFDLPTVCQTPTAPPFANYSFTIDQICGTRVQFTDLSQSTPQAWRWDFGDGATDTVRNPSHEYSQGGTYIVKLVVTNSLGMDSSLKNILITLPAGPTAADQNTCIGGQVLLTASGGARYFWQTSQGDTISTNPQLPTPPLFDDTTFFVSQITDGDTNNVGPIDGSFAAGGYHNTGFTGALNFEAFSEFELISAWVDAGSPGPRTIFLWSSINGGGNIVDSITVNIPAGPQRINLNFRIPGPGIYSVGGTSIDLFRNSENAAYPYVINGILSINSSSATTGPSEFYYYLYDWEVRGPSCVSELVPVTVTVSSADFSFVEDSTNRTFTFTDESDDATSWSWDFGDGNTSTLQNPVHTYALPGDYRVTLVINGSCFKEDSIKASIIAGLEDLNQMDIKLLPNPASKRTLLSFGESFNYDVALRMTNMEGKLIENRTLKAGSQEISWDLQNLSKGIYFIQVQAKEKTQTIKLLVE
ncbi:MAG: T9SS-dependent M36 family metallopeptidase [Bacteroidia bacterium]|nr:T9SS-dependent M36 family metallopeptidase [Bacteroidia bacterium]